MKKAIENKQSEIARKKATYRRFKARADKLRQSAEKKALAKKTKKVIEYLHCRTVTCIPGVAFSVNDGQTEHVRLIGAAKEQLPMDAGKITLHKGTITAVPYRHFVADIDGGWGRLIIRGETPWQCIQAISRWIGEQDISITPIEGPKALAMILLCGLKLLDAGLALEGKPAKECIM